MRDPHVAAGLLAEGVNAFGSRLHLRRQIFLPALITESMLACECEAIALINFFVADGAVAAMHLG